MTKLFATTALAASLAFPALAAQPAAGEKLADDQSFTYWVLDSIKSFDPAIMSDTSGSDVARSLFEGLMNEAPDGSMDYGTAESHEVSEDGLTYTFKIRENAKWSNGDPVTAGDFVYSWRRVADPETASSYAWFLELMNIANAKQVVAGELPPEELGVKAIDDHTLEVKLALPTPYFVKMLSDARVLPVHQKTIETYGDDWTEPGNLVGNGAFVLTKRQPGVQFTMEKNPEYWDAENVILETVTGRIVNDENAALTRFLAGELDMTQIPAGQYPRLEEQYPDAAHSVPRSCSYAFLYNLSDKGPEALKDARVRKAISLGIRRDVIIDQILQGGQKPATTWTHWATEGLVPPEAAQEVLSPEAATRARELLAEAGYGPDNPLKLVLQYNTAEGHKKMAIAAQQFLKPLGIEITLKNVEWKVHVEKMQNQDFQIGRYAWCGDYNEPSTYLDFFQTSGNNYGKYSNAEYDKLLADAKTAEDPTELYTRAEEILAEDPPAAFVYHYTRVVMVDPQIRGYVTDNVLGTWYAKDIYRLAE